MTKHLVERATIVRQIRQFFESHDFLEVETPAIVPSPGMDLHLDAFAIADETDRYLITSPEYQMKRLLADGHQRIFQIGKAFRRAELGDRHNPEFTILEWYRANAGVVDVMRDTEVLVTEVTRGEVKLGAEAIRVEVPFAQMSLVDAYQEFARIPRDETLRLAREDEDQFYRLLVDKVEPAIEKYARPLFITDYPTTQASLARKKMNDPHVAERFELYLAGIELCNGFGELTDPIEQRRRFVADQSARRAHGRPIYPIDERFMSALEKGIPDSGGNALGLDRLVALACGTRNIRDVMAFSWDEL